MHREPGGDVTSTEELGEPLFTSRSSQIFEWRGNTLLKLFKPNVDRKLISSEELNTSEAYEKNISKVKCYGHMQIGDRTGLIIERVEGKTLISYAGDKPASVFRVPRLMARMQDAMHRTETDKIRSYKEMVLEALSSEPLSFLTDDERKRAASLILSLPDGNSILHLDYHPDNLMTDGDSSTIIDWMTAARGAPAADVAATLYLLREGEMIPGLNRMVALILEAIRKAICAGYLKEYKAITGITDREIECWRLPFLIVRLGVWNIESEVKVLQNKIKDSLKAFGCSDEVPRENKEGNSDELHGQLSTIAAAGIDLDDAMIVLRLAKNEFSIVKPRRAPPTGYASTILNKDMDGLRGISPLAATIFQNNKESNALISARSHYSRIAANEGLEIPSVLDDMAQIVGLEAKVCSAHNPGYVLKTLKSHNACFIADGEKGRSGSLAIGKSVKQAFAATLVLEKSARAYIQGKGLGGAKPINRIEASVMRLGYKLVYSRKAEEKAHQTAADIRREQTEKEFSIRKEIVELGKQLSRENLVQGTWGNISVRLDAETMLCTPSGMEYATITPYDIVRVRMDNLAYEGNMKPTGEKAFHAAILRDHPDVSCVIHTHPTHCSVFAAAHKKVEPREEKHRSILCGDIELAKYGFPSTKKLSRNVAAAIGKNRACIMENHGMLACGSSLEDAHEKCRIAEQCAKDALDALSM